MLPWLEYSDKAMKNGQIQQVKHESCHVNIVTKTDFCREVLEGGYSATYNVQISYQNNPRTVSDSVSIFTHVKTALSFLAANVN